MAKYYNNNKSKISNSIIIIGLIMVAILIIIAVSPIISAGKTKVISIDKLLGLDLTDDTVTSDVSGKKELKPETNTSAGGTTYSTIIRLNYNLDINNKSQNQVGLLFLALNDKVGNNGYWISHRTEETSSAFTGIQNNNTFKHSKVCIEDTNGKNITNSENLELLQKSCIYVTENDVDYKIEYKYDYIKTMTIAYAVTKNYVFKNISREVGVYKDIDVDFSNLTNQYVKNSAGEWEQVNIKFIIPVVLLISEVISVDAIVTGLTGSMDYPVIDTVDIKE